jgi:hypothetical protein
MAMRSLSLLTLIIHLLIAIPRYSIDSSLFPTNLPLEEKHSGIAQLSKARALHFKHSMNFTVEKKTEQGTETVLQPGILLAWSSLYVA